MIRLQAEVRSLKDLEQENQRLREQMAFAQRDRRHLIPCEVIGRDSEGWWQTLRLNKGLAEGLTTNLAVVSVGGLVGKVISASTHSADVLLISDPACRVSAQVLRTGSFGVVSGRGPSWKGQVLSRMEFINKNTPILAGDEVVTSGLGGIFPKGLLIGYVDKVYLDRSGLYQHADVITRADLGSLQYVFVLRGGADGALYRADEPEPKDAS
jgi:rod shape-determining protein MreC